LLASGRNYRYLGGDNVTACPERRDYAASDVMVLRFEPLAAGSSTFSYVTGQAGEKVDRRRVSGHTILEFSSRQVELSLLVSVSQRIKGTQDPMSASPFH
jgi:hypothetical protein